MTEEKDETLEILKLLVSKIQQLEEKMNESDNMLMKSGFVAITSPLPRMDKGAGVIPDSDQIAKMSWKEINTLVTNLEGQ
jgi:hypothetical protein